MNRYHVLILLAIRAIGAFYGWEIWKFGKVLLIDGWTADDGPWWILRIIVVAGWWWLRNIFD